MKKLLGAFFYLFGGLGLISSFIGLSKLLGPEGGGDAGPGMAGQMVGLFIIPIAFLWIGYTVRKDET